MRSLIPLMVFLVMVLFLWAGLSLDPREIPSPLIGKAAPSFDLASLEDPSRRISPSDFKGQAILVNVFASWCASCRDEHPTLLAFSSQFGIPILGLNYKDHPEAATSWLKRHGNPYKTVALDLDGRAAINWGVYGVPETFVVDAEGLIRLKHTGPVTEAVLKDKILPLLKELGVTSP